MNLTVQGYLQLTMVIIATRINQQVLVMIYTFHLKEISSNEMKSDSTSQGIYFISNNF